MNGYVDKHLNEYRGPRAVITGHAIITSGRQQQASWTGLTIKIGIGYLMMLAILATAPSWHSVAGFEATQVLACTDSGGVR
ncbi:MAG: hypothetical protein AAGA73_01210 [Pseudomonadota bacterium]